MNLFRIFRAGLQRLREPSTAAGIGLLVALFAPQAAPVVPELLTQLAGAGLALTAIIRRDAPAAHDAVARVDRLVDTIAIDARRRRE